MYLVERRQTIHHDPSVSPVFLTDDPVKALEEARLCFGDRPERIEHVVIYRIMVGVRYTAQDSRGTEDDPCKTVMYIARVPGYTTTDVTEDFYHDFKQLSHHT